MRGREGEGKSTGDDSHKNKIGQVWFLTDGMQEDEDRLHIVQRIVWAPWGGGADVVD